MFITFKNKARGRAETGSGSMEQVAQKNAGPDANNGKMRTLRRPACMSCQKKKLRCYGSTETCERCKAQSIDCVFSSSSCRTKTSHSSTKTSSSTTNQAQTDTQQDAYFDPFDQDALYTRSTQSDIAATLPTSNDSLDGSFPGFVQDFDVSFDTSGFNRETLDFYHDTDTHAAFIGSSSTATYDPNLHSHLSTQSYSSYTDPLSTTQSLAYTSDPLDWQAQDASYSLQGILPQPEEDGTNSIYPYFEDIESRYK